MDHTEALRLQAAEKYVLGELRGDLRDQYEQHFLDCAECALDLKTAAAFVETSRAVFREDAVAALAAERAGRRTDARPSFIQRFRWTFAAVPAFAALVFVMVVNHQDNLTISDLRHSAALSASAAAPAPVLDLPPTSTRTVRKEAANETPFQVRPDQPFSVKFDFTPPMDKPGPFVCQLIDNASGRVLLQLAVPSNLAASHYTLPVPANLIPASGKYQITFLNADPVTNLPLVSDPKPVQSFTIDVAFPR